MILFTLCVNSYFMMMMMMMIYVWGECHTLAKTQDIIILFLQVVKFDVNKETDSTGDFLVHAIIKQGKLLMIMFLYSYSC